MNQHWFIINCCKISWHFIKIHNETFQTVFLASYAVQSDSYVTLSNNTWWRHQMETFSALLALCAGNSPVTGEFPTQRPVTRSFDVFFDLWLNKGLSKQSWGWWFETPSNWPLYDNKHQELLWCQLCRPWWHWRLFISEVIYGLPLYNKVLVFAHTLGCHVLW